MDKRHAGSLQERVERLEAVVAELQSVLYQKEGGSRQRQQEETGSPPEAPDREQPGAPPIPQTPAATPPRPARKSIELPESMRSSEYWFNKIGIGLVLFGVAFLFKYSIDKGWLTPHVRVGFGVIIGMGLVIAGIRISSERRHFGQVLMGGGIAAFYITGFAAFQVFTLVSHPVAFAFMVFVTLLAFVLSLKQNGAVLAIIGAIGGLGTPFLLYTGSGNLPGLVGYTCLLLSGTGAIFFYRGWPSLLWTSVIGGWSVFLIGLDNAFATDPTVATSDLWALQLGILFGWLAFWLLPLMRRSVWAKNPTRRHRPSIGSGQESTSILDARFVLDPHVHLLSVATPLIALGMSMSIWSLSDQIWGSITLGGAILYGLASWCLSRLNVVKHFSYTHSLVAVVLLTIALYLLLDGNTLLFALATEAAVLHVVAHRVLDKRVTFSAHLLFGALGLWLVQRIFSGQAEGTAVFNMQALTDLWVIGCASGASTLFSSSEERRVYLFLVHIAILGWLLRELSSLANGQGYVTIAWGVYSVILLVLGLRLNFQRLRTVAIGTLLIVVGKLFIVDLSELETIWRVLLFLGFGGLFLVLSYYFRALWKPNLKPSNQLDE